MDPGIIIGIVIVWIACAFGCMTVASRKNKNPVLWFWLGLLLGIIALLIIGFLQAEVNTRSSISPVQQSLGVIVTRGRRGGGGRDIPGTTDRAAWRAHGGPKI